MFIKIILTTISRGRTINDCGGRGGVRQKWEKFFLAGYMWRKKIARATGLGKENSKRKKHHVTCTKVYMGVIINFGYIPLKVEDGTLTFEHKFLKKLPISNVYLKEMPLAGHLYKVTMQKVPQILRQKPGKI